MSMSETDTGRDLYTVEDGDTIFFYEPDVDENSNRRVKADTYLASNYWFDLDEFDQ